MIEQTDNENEDKHGLLLFDKCFTIDYVSQQSHFEKCHIYTQMTFS